MFAAAERLLRGGIEATPRTRTCFALGATGGALAGLALGLSSGEPWLAVFAAIKVPLLLLLTAVLCVPSFYVVNTLLGLRDDFAAACRSLIAAQAALGVALGALAPVLVFQALSIHDPYGVTLCDALLFALAAWVAQQILARHHAPLMARNPRHRLAVRGWLILYAFTGVQLAWVLRPFRGTEGYPVQFFRPEAFEHNAYVVLIEHVLRLGR